MVTASTGWHTTGTRSEAGLHRKGEVGVERDRLTQHAVPMSEPADVTSLPAARDDVVARRRGVRLTTRVFWDLGIWITGLGIAIGLVFPAFAVVLGVPARYVETTSFRMACLGAGLLLAATSYGLARGVVGRRLVVLSTALQRVAADLATASRTGDWSHRGAPRIAVDSDDELGDTARSFNSLLDALEAGEHFRAIVRNASDVITIVDRRLEITYQTPSVGWVLGYPPGSLLGSDVRALLHPEDVAAFDEHLSRVSGGAARLTTISSRIRHRNGSWRWVETVVSDLLDDPSITGIVLTTRDVSDRKELEDQLRTQAFHDPLTGLPNRALFMERLRGAEAYEASAGVPSAVLFLDLDDLKTVNDNAGHEVGDALLKIVADRILGCLRPEDTLARLAGDEFAILLVGPRSDELAISVAERALASLGEPVVIGDQSVSAGVSIGIATSGTSSESGIGLLRAADVAMYVAKTSGKGRYEVFRPSHHADQLAREELLADLQHALDDDQFRLFYQPIVNLRSGTTTGYEALVRWQHPTRGLVPPALFIELAEESGLIVPLGRWVLAEATRQAAQWLAEGRHPEFQMSVNVSVRQFEHPGLLRDVTEALQRSGWPAEHLTLEITESLFVRDAVGTIAKLQEIKELGVQLALDDFGTGWSSLSHLRRFPIDILKIDKSFIDGLTNSPEDWAVVGAIVSLGQILQLTVVAEGIETATEMDTLRVMGVHHGQGYLLGRPAPADTTAGSTERRLPESAGSAMRLPGRPRPSRQSETDPLTA